MENVQETAAKALARLSEPFASKEVKWVVAATSRDGMKGRRGTLCAVALKGRAIRRALPPLFQIARRYLQQGGRTATVGGNCDGFTMTNAERAKRFNECDERS